MDTVGTFEAKTHLTRLLDRVASGEQITITRHGTPIARLVPVKPTSSRQIRETIAKLKQLSAGQTLGGLQGEALVDALPIVIDERTPNFALSSVLELSRRQQLSAYDASYLELAMRRGVPLATKDNDLARAANHMGVTLLPTA